MATAAPTPSNGIMPRVGLSARLADLAPGAIGANTMVIEQEAPLGRTVLQVLASGLNSSRLGPMMKLVTATAVGCGLKRLNVVTPTSPTATLPKSWICGVTVTFGSATTVALRLAVTSL